MERELVATLLQAGRPDLATAIARQTPVVAADPSVLLHKLVPGVGSKIKLDRYKQEPNGTKFWLTGLPRLMREAHRNVDLLGKQHGIETDYIDEKKRGDPATLVVWVPSAPKLNVDDTAEQLDKNLVKATGAYRQQVRAAIEKTIGRTSFDSKPLLQEANRLVDQAASTLYNRMVDLLERQAK